MTGAVQVGAPRSDEVTGWTLWRYSNSGASTNYADSVALTTFWWWSPNVPRYSLVSTTNVMNPLMSPFGYVY